MSDLLGDTAAALDTALRAGTALTARLSTIPTSGTVLNAAIYDMQGPEAATLPMVVYQHQGGGPDNMNASEIESNVWLVKVYSAATAKDASEIFALVDELIHKKAIGITGVTVFWCHRETNVKLVETPPDGKPIYMRGGLYRIRTSS